MDLSSSRDKQYLMVLLQAVAMFALAPVVYLAVAYYIKTSQPITKETDPIILWVLLAVAGVQLLVTLPLVNRFVVAAAGMKSPNPWAGPAQTVTILRMAIVESIFIFGLVYFFISWELEPLVYFYAIGLVGVALNWPTRERFDNLANQLEAK